ncbi:sugar ABC transporter substrate-binding protein [bacterium]|nr:sugar ABC transporter substrate-binding protein [bacterium]
MNKVVSLVLVAITFCGLCLFTGLANDYNSNQTTVQFASWGSESELKILKPLIENFQKENPQIHVEFLHIPQNYFQKIHLLFASNTAPDVIFINNQYLPVYANAGVLEDLSGYEEEFQFDDFYKKSLESLKWNGKIYAVPRDVSNLIVFYNKNIFNKSGIKYPSSDWNFDNFLLTAQKLTDNDVFGVSFEETPLLYLPYLTSNGGWSRDDTENYFVKDVLSRPENKFGLDFYANLRKKYHVAPKRDEVASATMAQMFLQERIGMYISGRWMVPKFREEAKFDWDVVEFPKGRKGSIVPMDASGWAIAKASKHKQEAIKLVRYLSGANSSYEFTRSGLIVPARIDISKSAFLDGKRPKNAQAFLNIIETSVPTPVTVNYREIIDDLKKRTEYLFN